MLSFDSIKPIRNKIRKFNGWELLKKEILALHEVKGSDIEKIRSCPPWYLMLLVKWTLMYGDFDSQGRSVKQNDLINLINMTHQLAGKVKMPNQYDMRAFLKNIAFQQFWYQTRFQSVEIGRQVKLFVELMPSGLSDKSFDIVAGDA